MRVARLVVFVVLAGLAALAIVVDQGDRAVETLDAPLRPGVPALSGATITWYCTGGSGPDGVAEVGLELINVSDSGRRVVVTGLPGGRIEVEGLETELELAPSARETMSLADLAPGAEYVGAVVEVDGLGVLVEQTSESVTGTSRAPCSTHTDAIWIVPSGATRLEAEGERMVIVMLNPFPDDAVADIAFSADVGTDSEDGVVIPAGHVAAFEVTDEVTVAGQVSAVIRMVAGRVSAARIQVSDGPIAGRGLRVTPAVPAGAVVSVLPMVEIRDGRRDVVSVTNPDPERSAEVDLEITPDDPTITVDPIELTVRPGRTVTVDLSSEARLADVEGASVTVRSLDGLPVAADLATTVTEDSGQVSGTSGVVGIDAASVSWLVAMETMADDVGSRLVVLNPSTVAIATVELRVDGELEREVEIGPGRRFVVGAAELGRDRFVTEVVSSAPVVVARELTGLTSRSAAPGVVTGEVVDYASIP